jgi:hypothetical protein
MIILHFTGKGEKMLQGVSEYLMLFEAEEDIRSESTATIEESIQRKTAPGFELADKFDTEIAHDTDYCSLPLGRMLIPK